MLLSQHIFNSVNSYSSYDWFSILIILINTVTDSVRLEKIVYVCLCICAIETMLTCVSKQ